MQAATDRFNRRGGRGGHGHISIVPRNKRREVCIIDEAVGVPIAGSALTQKLFMAMNNTNVQGVVAGNAGANAGAGSAVDSGIELSISLAALGGANVFDDIRVVAMVDKANHNYLSNQVLAGLPAPRGNMGGDRTGSFTGSLSQITFAGIARTQFVTVLTCRADLPNDGVVDDDDFLIFVKAYNNLVCADPEMPTGCPADLSEDGFVDDSDFPAFVGAYNDLICP
ncbi:MAG: hypothetical protein J0L78_00030 [Planctomycetes bacterium]|nr:hypothetical protein [Planctomycetota bacterium]